MLAEPMTTDEQKNMKKEIHKLIKDGFFQASGKLTPGETFSI